MDENRKRELEFHRSRRMFVVINNKLFIAPKNIILSHKEWLESEGLLENDINFNDILRGFVDWEGVYFYKNNDFSVDKKAENIFFGKLNELIFELEIDLSKDIFGGWIVQKRLGKWKPKKHYGKIKDFLN